MKFLVNVDKPLERLIIFIIGLLIMSFGIVLVITADLGSAPWDVLNIGLFYQFGLSIGSWAIIVGFFVLLSASLLAKTIPAVGAILNMFLVGLFIDAFLLLPFMQTPPSIIGKGIMFLLGLIIMGYGIGLYISAKLGAGPRDSLMIILSEKLGWSIAITRLLMEAMVLLIGWLLGGPVFFGTIIYAILIGKIAGWSIPQCEKLTIYLLSKLSRKKQIEIREYSKQGAK
ncbi:YczE/YyaS/YitT family protein [Bacillus sp. B1-b2]|uniref:YczE/YyaS/YitT family protein n=1 Tax=Bacillus sp. B1-b2 TaxID=2653201 RepID=UPI001262648E|nr:YitT family protein [Bacillus sp. B1-b2]KAB7667284.1 YitT family protein [Bacillus sp. B1-b2]